VYAAIRPAGGAPCAPTPRTDSGEQLIGGQEVNGSFSVQATTTESKAGTYLICLWLAASSETTPAVAGPQPVLFTVGYPPPPPPPPPPPCIVPTLRANTRLTAIERRIRAAHCRLGRIRYSHTRRIRRGIVVSLSPRPRARLSSGSRVAILVSLGRGR
jgi:hypothetical protein